MGGKLFFMSASAICNLKEGLPQLHNCNFLMKCCPATAYLHFSDHKFFNSIFKFASFYRNAASKLHIRILQSFSEVRTKKVVELLLQTGKIGLRHILAKSGLGSIGIKNYFWSGARSWNNIWCRFIHSHFCLYLFTGKDYIWMVWSWL